MIAANAARMTLALSLAAAGAASASAQSPKIQRVDIVEYGIYTVNETNCHRDDQGIERCERSDVHHAATTWIIPAQHGVEFGLKYRVVGTPKGASVALKRDWLLPNPGFLESGKPPLKRIDRTDNGVIGDTTYVSYGFDDPWELVPGPWILEIWSGGRKLTSQTFTVVKQ